MSGTSVLLLLLLTTVAMSVNGFRWDKSRKEPDMSSSRDGKFFSFFNIVRFSNNICNATTDTKGICYTGKQCSDKKGRQVTGCAMNFGSCCVFEHSCNQITAEKVSYFQNPEFSSKQDGPIAMCSFRVDIEDDDVCQVRLDFLEFEIDPPDTATHKCSDDTFTITDAMGFESLCGNNKGQHLYIPVDKSSGMSSVNMRFDIDTDSNVIWNIQVKQIDCNAGDPEEAPANCLQYHTDPSGTIQSFNFEGKKYFPDLNYAICIKRVSGTCKLELEAEKDEDFTLASMDFDNTPASTDAKCNDDTSKDFLLIPQVATTSAGKFTTLHCGDKLPVPANNMPPTSATSFGAGPIVLQFHTDDKLTDTEHEQGFNLKYKQSSSGC